jgi:bacterial microcompartment shell protein
MESLGFIEVKGWVTAVEAADAALKTAEVTLVGGNNPGAGLYSVIFQGEIGAIKTAVDAGVAAAKRIGEVVSYNIIARPEPEVYRLSQEPTL